MIRLGLGTAQFGMDYGITNAQGRLSADEADAVLGLAVANDVTVWDTAPGYGESEAVLGRWLSGHPEAGAVSVITKTPAFMGQSREEAALNLARSVEKSRERLQGYPLEGVLFHQADDLLGELADELIAVAEGLKECGTVSKIGVSVYTVEQIEGIFSRWMPDVVQVPLNVLDQRLVMDGTLRELTSKGVEIHARSIFLQGILLQPQQAPAKLRVFQHVLDQYSRFLEYHNLTPMEAALGFLKHLPMVDVALVGVGGLENFNEILRVWKCLDSLPAIDFSELNCTEARLVNPAKWGEL